MQTKHAFKAMAAVSLSSFMALSSLGPTQAAESSKQPMFETAIDIGIPMLIFERPSQGLGVAGSIAFERVDYFYTDLAANIDNSKRIFDSQIFVRPGFIGFQSPVANVGFALEKQNIINSINKAKLIKSQFSLNNKRLNFAGTDVALQFPGTSLSVTNFSLNCLRDQNNINSSAASLIGGCFNALTLNGQSPSDLPDFELSFKEITTGKYIKFKSKLKQFQVKENYFDYSAVDTYYEIPGSALFTSKNTNLQCEKNLNIDDLKNPINVQQILSTCENNVLITSGVMNFDNKTAGTHFVINPKLLKIKSNVFQAQVPSLQMTNGKTTTALSQTSLNCFKGSKSDIFNVGDVIVDCLKSGSISIKEIVTSSPKTATDEQNEEKLINFFLEGLKKFHPWAAQDAENSSKDTNRVKNIQINLKSHKIDLSAGLKVFIDLNIGVTGDIDFDKSTGRFLMHIKEARLPFKLPFGPSPVQIVMFFIKKFMLSKTVQVDAQNNIIIQI